MADSMNEMNIHSSFPNPQHPDGTDASNFVLTPLDKAEDDLEVAMWEKRSDQYKDLTKGPNTARAAQQMYDQQAARKRIGGY